MIKGGEIVFLHFFDLCGEVETKGLEERLKDYGRTSFEQIPGSSWIEDGVRIAVPENVEITGEKASIELKVFPVGALMVKISLPVGDKDFPQTLEAMGKAEDEIVKQGVSQNMIDFSKELSARVKETIKPLISSQYPLIDHWERYRVIIAKDAVTEKSEREIAGLIRKESFDRLGKTEVDDITSNKYSYRDNVFIADVRGAFAVVKNPETFPVMRAVELFLLQRLELRVYDSLLDEMLTKSYGILDKAESSADHALGENINDIHLMRLELLEIVSGMKKTSTNPKARVFSSLCSTIGEEFEIEDMVDSVSRKLEKLGEIYTMVYDSLQTTRSIKMEKTVVLLEVIVVILIVIEILLALYGH